MLNLKDIYFSPADAMVELEHRQVLRPRIEAWFHSQGLEAPLFRDIQRPAVLARHVATAMYSDCVFEYIARDAGFTPVWCEYTGDVYVAKNTYKRALVDRVVAEGRGRSGGLKSRNHRLVSNLPPLEKKQLSDIRVDSGGSLPDFHRQLRPEGWIRIEQTEWLRCAGGRAHLYYIAVLAQYVCHGVNFENFHEGGSGKDSHDEFTERIFLPAWQEVVRQFGVRPIIVRLPWHDSALHYPPSVTSWMDTQVIEPEFLARIKAGV